MGWEEVREREERREDGGRERGREGQGWSGGGMERGGSVGQRREGRKEGGEEGEGGRGRRKGRSGGKRRRRGRKAREREGRREGGRTSSPGLRTHSLPWAAVSCPFAVARGRLAPVWAVRGRSRSCAVASLRSRSPRACPGPFVVAHRRVVRVRSRARCVSAPFTVGRVRTRSGRVALWSSWRVRGRWVPVVVRS